MSFKEFKENKPKSVTGMVRTTDWGGGNEKIVKRTFYWSYSKYIDRMGWFNRNRGKKITDEVAYQFYLESITFP